MTLEKLWDDLEPRKETLQQLKKDYERGITPELPYFIVGQHEAKEKVGTYLNELDGDYFNRSLIYSDYGNGKTNLLKYLELYFEENKNKDIHYIYQRANIDKPDIFLNLLKLIEDSKVDILSSSIDKLSEKFVKEQKTAHSNIAAYIDRIYNNPAERNELILMGTGRYYTKNYYNNHIIPPLSDFDRREVFVFFMNALSENEQYIVFALDEIEKIYEKSKLRFRSFLTSYRELIDLSGQINGHFLLSAIVSSAANIDDILLENPAFFSRIKKDMIKVGFLTLDNEKKELIKKIADLLELKLTDAKIKDIVSELKRNYGKGTIRSNRYLLADVYNALNKESGEPVFAKLEDILEKLELEDEFDEMYEDLDDGGSFSKIEKRFFDPLQYYLEYKGYRVETTDTKKRNLFKNDKLFYPNKSNKVYSFILNNNANINEEINKLNELLQDNQQLVIAFTPEKLDIKYENFESENITIVNYDPKEMFTLLVMFEELEFQEDIEKVIGQYTKGEF